MANTAGIVGAGVIGRLMALELHRLGWQVSLFDEDGMEATKGCSHAGAGMLAPFSELEKSQPIIADLGLEALELWPGIMATLSDAGHPTYFQHDGSLVVAHPSDEPELQRLSSRVLEYSGQDSFEQVESGRVRELEPGLDAGFNHGLYFENEGLVGTRLLLPELGAYLQNIGVQMRLNERVEALAPNQITAAGGKTEKFDQVLDCRGLGGMADMSDLRGVRGELIAVLAPEVTLHRPVRLMHPRYPLYVVPRPDSIYLIGATNIESQDMSPMTVRSTLELLSAAYTLSSAFAEANIIDMVVQCRPAFPDNHPRVEYQPGLCRVNGFYRHGYLIGPRVVQMVGQYLETGATPTTHESIFQQAS